MPTFQKLNSVLLKDMDKKERASSLHLQLAAQREATEVNVAPEPASGSVSPADINIYVFLNLFHLFIVVVQYSLMAWFGRWVLYRILKTYQNKRGGGRKKTTQEKRCNCPLEERRGRVGWGNPVGSRSAGLHCSPLSQLKNITHAGQTHTVPPPQCNGNLLWGREAWSNTWVWELENRNWRPCCINILPMSTSWLCCKVNPQLCSCSE